VTLLTSFKMPPSGPWNRSRQTWPVQSGVRQFRLRTSYM